MEEVEVDGVARMVHMPLFIVLAGAKSRLSSLILFSNNSMHFNTKGSSEVACIPDKIGIEEGERHKEDAKQGRMLANS